MSVSGKHKNWKSKWVQVYSRKIELVCFLTLLSNFSLFSQKIDGGDGSHYSVLVESIVSGEIIDSKNADLLMTPASTLKVASTAMALETLGADYRFSTGIYVQGTIANGTLNGNLTIKGGGDGTLGSSYFSSTTADQMLKDLQKQLNDAGIMRIKGSVYLDKSLFPANHYPDGRLWEDMANYYGAPPAAISWRDNSFDLFLKSPAVRGLLCEVMGTFPVFSDLQFNSYVYAAVANKDSAYIFGYPGLEVWEVRGSIPAGRSSFKIKGALPFPGKQLGEELARLFSSDEVIDVRPSTKPVKYESLEKVAHIDSPPLSEIIQVVNRRSHNLLADHLFLAAGRANMDSYNWDASRDYFKRFWAGRLSFPPLRVLDGSGLSPKNLVSARFMVDVLKYMHQSPNFEVFKSSLAVGGQSGTLSNLWKGPLLAGKVVAKSGYMEGTLGYCGYIYTNKGNVLAFSIMVNHMTNDLPAVRKSIETYIADLIVRY
jgi:D-alanyl-D-alanine carboxypeptidase/D-alanyl-D-alanine-endopeptidase (penicillin-binding protein 4)